jgi:hypothetical protein
MLGGPVAAAAGAARATVLLDGTTEIAAGKCGEPVKLNLGDLGYYRAQYDDAMLAALAGAPPPSVVPKRSPAASAIRPASGVYPLVLLKLASVVGVLA